MITNGDLLRVAVRFKWQDLSDIVNVWHFLVNDVGTAATDVDVMTAIADLMDTWYGNMQGTTDPEVTGEDLTGINITKDELLPGVPLIWAGTNPADMFPLTTTPMLSFNSSTPRHGSRIYLPPIVEGNAIDGVLSGAMLTILGTMAAAVLAGFVHGTTGTDISRVSFERATSTVRALQTAFVPTILRTQRRRRQGVGS